MIMYKPFFILIKVVEYDNYFMYVHAIASYKSVSSVCLNVTY